MAIDALVERDLFAIWLAKVVKYCFSIYGVMMKSIKRGSYKDTGSTFLTLNERIGDKYPEWRICEKLLIIVIKVPRFMFINSVARIAAMLADFFVHYFPQNYNSHRNQNDELKRRITSEK
uniref:Uncharacterized protein n=1 Tax=Romanomermis culicivorax TaxID=13658 RepID=A0A915HPN5_ROMCU